MTVKRPPIEEMMESSPISYANVGHYVLTLEECARALCDAVLDDEQLRLNPVVWREGVRDMAYPLRDLLG